MGLLNALEPPDPPVAQRMAYGPQRPQAHGADKSSSGRPASRSLSVTIQYCRRRSRSDPSLQVLSLTRLGNTMWCRASGVYRGCGNLGRGPGRGLTLTVTEWNLKSGQFDPRPGRR